MSFLLDGFIVDTIVPFVMMSLYFEGMVSLFVVFVGASAAIEKGCVFCKVS